MACCASLLLQPFKEFTGSLSPSSQIAQLSSRSVQMNNGGGSVVIRGLSASHLMNSKEGCRIEDGGLLRLKQTTSTKSRFFGESASTTSNSLLLSPSISVARPALHVSRSRFRRQAIADRGTKTVTGAEEAGGSRKEDLLIEDVGKLKDKVEYDWEKEWYPMYLSDEMPQDSPLGLTVFDRSVVLYYDGKGVLNCLEDRCPHRSAKLSEGQVTDGRLECLYHGWQFEGDGVCAKIPQLPSGAKIPKAACARSYAVQESQGVIWVWLADKATADPKKLPWFEHYAREGFQHISTIHELPYDYSILLENLMDPAHIPISHDRTDLSAKRENAQALVFDVTERTSRGFAGKWGEISSPVLSNTTRFEAPCCLRNDKEFVNKEGKTEYFSALFLCRPAGQGKSMLIVRFGGTNFGSRLKWIPPWIIHKTSNTVFEQDMGFLASQNETLMRKGVATKDLYLNLKSSDTWVTEYRKWLDLTGHGMPYYFGHRTFSLPTTAAIFESAPAGPVAAIASSYPSKGSFGLMFSRDPTNRYFRHVVHCKSCLGTLNSFKKFQKGGRDCKKTKKSLLETSRGIQAKFMFIFRRYSHGHHKCPPCQGSKIRGQKHEVGFSGQEDTQFQPDFNDKACYNPQ